MTGVYRAVATNTAGSTESDPATLTVNLIPPTIIAGPNHFRVSNLIAFGINLYL